MLLTSSWICDIIVFITTVCFLTYKYFTRNFDYWKKRDIHYLEPKPIFGNLGDVLAMKLPLSMWLKKIYDSSEDRYLGMFLFDQPCLVVKCPVLIQHVLVKDFSKFTSRTVAPIHHDEVVSEFLFMQRNPTWRMMRKNLAPVFSSRKLKSMFPTINKSGQNLVEYISKYYMGPREAKEPCSVFTLDILTKCVFGLDANLFDKEKPEIWKLATDPFRFTLRNAFPQIMIFFAPRLLYLLKLDIFPKECKNFFVNLFLDTIRSREKSELKGNNMIDTIIELKKDEKFCEDTNFYGKKVAAPALQFLMAGFETTGITISFLLYELAMNPEIQTKLRNEIMENMESHGGLSYDGMNKMKYLDMCLKENLRKYTVFPFLDRLCLEDYQLPGTNLVVEKGTFIFISMMGMHYNPKYFPQPQKFDPERFAGDRDINSDGIIYAPFGQGPRMCIGDRFGTMASKIAICNLLPNFVIERTTNTPETIKFAVKSLLIQSDVGLPVEFKKYSPK